MTLVCGDILSGNFSHSGDVCVGNLMSPGGVEVKGTFFKGRAHGLCWATWPDGQRFLREYCDGKLLAQKQK